jgi:uncharacterized protein with GYD domain
MLNSVVLGNWKNQGIKKVKDAPERIKQTRNIIEKAGGKMQFIYNAGEYNLVMTIKIPNEDDLMAVLLCIGSMANVCTTTMKAWTQADGAKILTALHP